MWQLGVCELNEQSCDAIQQRLCAPVESTHTHACASCAHNSNMCRWSAHAVGELAPARVVCELVSKRPLLEHMAARVVRMCRFYVQPSVGLLAGRPALFFARINQESRKC